MWHSHIHSHSVAVCTFFLVAWLKKSWARPEVPKQQFQMLTSPPTWIEAIHHLRLPQSSPKSKVHWVYNVKHFGWKRHSLCIQWEVGKGIVLVPDLVHTRVWFQHQQRHIVIDSSGCFWCVYDSVVTLTKPERIPTTASRVTTHIPTETHNTADLYTLSLYNNNNKKNTITMETAFTLLYTGHMEEWERKH